MSHRRSRLTFQPINVGVESLESRVVPSHSPSGVAAHSAEIHSSSHDASGHSGSDNSAASETNLTGVLTSSDPAVTASGTVNFESETHGTSTGSEFTVRAAGLAPSTAYDVAIDGVVVGQLHTNASGAGQLQFETGSSSHPLPSNFPAISVGSVVTVGSSLSATLAAPAAPTSPGGSGSGSTDHSHESDTETHLQASLRDATGVSPLRGRAEFESETEQGLVVSVFQVSVNHAVPGTTLDVQVNGASVGSILVNASGRGSLVYSSHPVAGRSLAFPDNFPTIIAGSTITVGGVAMGTFGA